MVATQSRAERKRTQKTRAILQAAAELLTERGYAGTNLEDIAERLDLAKASLYHYYPSKEALVTACLEFAATTAIERLVIAVESESEPLAKLRALIIEQIRIVALDPAAAASLFLVPIDWPDPLLKNLRQWRSRHDDLFRAVIAEGVASGVLHPSDVDVARHCMHGALNSTPAWLKGKRSTVDATVAAIADVMLDMFVADVRPARKR
jgi:AcrR family transcriptional regulator